MSTITNLVRARELIKLEATLGFRQYENRRIYARPSVIQWLQEDLPNVQPFFESELSPLEQLDAFLTVFCSGQALTFPRQFHVLQHHSAGIWELKTAEIRLVGWFSAKDVFICAECESATVIKQQRLYASMRNAAARCRSNLGLSAEYIQGDDPRDVVSAYITR